MSLNTGGCRISGDNSYKPAEGLLKLLLNSAGNTVKFDFQFLLLVVRTHMIATAPSRATPSLAGSAGVHGDTVLSLPVKRMISREAYFSEAKPQSDRPSLHVGAICSAQRPFRAPDGAHAACGELTTQMLTRLDPEVGSLDHRVLPLVLSLS